MAAARCVRAGCAAASPPLPLLHTGRWAASPAGMGWVDGGWTAAPPNAHVNSTGQKGSSRPVHMPMQRRHPQLPGHTWLPPRHRCPARRLASASSCCSRCADSQLARCRASAACWQKRAADSRTRCRICCSSASAARAAGSGGSDGGGGAPCGLSASVPWLCLVPPSSSGSLRAAGGGVQQEHAIGGVQRAGDGSGRRAVDSTIAGSCR